MNIGMNNVWFLLLATARSESNGLALAASFKELQMSVIFFCMYDLHLFKKRKILLTVKRNSGAVILIVGGGHVSIVLFSLSRQHTFNRHLQYAVAPLC